MDLVEVLRSRIGALAPGDYSAGLGAILQHVRTAVNHLVRGQNSGDETAFTDAIYRTNQAFEGSLKEAYRVLAGKDPSAKTPFQIETYLQDTGVLRPRVLDQVSAYRKDWRNPSTHDYRLDFDEDEALLAVVSICALAIVLVDQIAGRVRFEEARANVRAPLSTSVSTPLLEQVVAALEQFRFEPNDNSVPPRTVEVVGAIAGYLSAALPIAEVQANDFSGPRPNRADVIVTCGEATVLVEVRRDRERAAAMDTGILQLRKYLEAAGVNDGVVFLYAPLALSKRVEELVSPDKRIIVLAPELSRPA